VTSPSKGQAPIRRFVLGLTIIALAAAGCQSVSPVDATTVGLTITDSSIVATPTVVTTGHVAFNVRNQGTLVHEIEVFAGSETVLPVVRNVADTASLDLVDEVEDIIPDGRVTLTLDLAAGDYVILCNLPGHYEMGMVTMITVID
jgi:uncharacterized cupredoxin-like copper-binding protein